MSLTENYKKALRALKDQAEAMSVVLRANEVDKDTQAARSALRDAQLRMSEVTAETMHIVRLVLNPELKGVTIPTMTEEILEDLLSKEAMSKGASSQQEIAKRITGMMGDGEPDWRAYYGATRH